MNQSVVNHLKYHGIIIILVHCTFCRACVVLSGILNGPLNSGSVWTLREAISRFSTPLNPDNVQIRSRTLNLLRPAHECTAVNEISVKRMPCSEGNISVTPTAMYSLYCCTVYYAAILVDCGPKCVSGLFLNKQCYMQSISNHILV